MPIIAETIIKKTLRPRKCDSCGCLIVRGAQCIRMYGRAFRTDPAYAQYVHVACRWRGFVLPEPEEDDLLP